MAVTNTLQRGGTVVVATTSGISSSVSDVPEGWHTIAAENSRAMEEDRATRKPLYSNSPSRIED